MAYSAVTVKRFGGLQASTDPADVGLDNAVDLLNVEFSADRSRVKTRPGVALIGAANALAGTPHDMAIMTNPAAIEYVVAVGISGANIFVDGMAADGSYTAAGTYAHTATPTSPVNAVAHGVPGSQRVFIASEGTLMRYTDMVSLSAASVGAPRYLGVTPDTNRLVQAGFDGIGDSPTGANGDQAAVFFSNAGAPTTFSSDDYVLLDPGDSEKIHGVATWNSQTFVFKESRCYVFYGESTDSTGSPVFLYRRVGLPTSILNPGLSGAFHRVAAGARGVYYLAGDGVYLTTGGVPVKISDPLNDVFAALTSSDAFTIAPVDDRVFLIANGGTHYVLDERNGQWSKWVFGVAAVDFVAPPISWHRTRPFGRAVVFQSGDSLFRCQEGLTTDPAAGTLASYYQSGQGDLGGPEVKTVRATDVWGKVTDSGLMTFQMAVDGGSLDTAASLTVGTSIGKGEDRVARRGNRFAWKVATPGNTQFELSEVSFYVRPSRDQAVTP